MDCGIERRGCCCIKRTNLIGKGKLAVSNRPLAVYLIYILFIWLCECMDLFCFFVSLPQQTPVSRMIALFFMTLLILGIFKKVSIKNTEKYDIIKTAGIIFIILVSLIKSIYPDTSFDVNNYHLISQSIDFTNFFEIGFGGGNFQIWGFRLGDRLFSPFINVLGYRCGTALNGLVIALLYIQIADLFDGLIPKEYKSQRIFNPAVLAFLIVTVHDVDMQMATYNVDLLALPLLIEMLAICMSNGEGRHEYFVLLAGAAFAIKMTNVVYIIPLLLVYLIKNREGITVIDFIKCFIIGVIPSGIYMIYSFSCTGNPVFPYMNSVFHSCYFLWQDFRDNRWGPVNIRETCLWIFYHIILPKYRQSEIPNRWTLNITISLIIFIVGILISIKRFRKKEKQICPVELYVVFIISGILWTITTGYSRYFVLGDVLLLIIFIASITQLIDRRIIGRSFTTALLYIMLLCSGLETLDVLMGREWAWRRPGIHSALDELNYVLRDQPETFEIEMDIDAFFLTEGHYGGVAFLTNKDAPIFNVSYRQYLETENLYLYENSYKSMMEKENIYDIKVKGFDDWEAYESDLKNYKLEIADKCIINNRGLGLIYIKLARCHFEGES